ncbi:MAG: DNA internalization-related competence protein ComEC/Rec2 [Ardenticatenales bacterium]|nr:DNA internalization-related competence protein ComEC/Rec2 [Ardenticatenales bacterium]
MPVFYFLLAWYAGLWLASRWALPLPWLWLGAGLGLAGTILAWRRPRWRWLTVALLGLCLAGWRFAATRPVLDATHLASYHNEESVLVTGRIIARPQTSERSQRLRVAASAVTLPNGSTYQVDGLLLVQAERYPAYAYGQAVTLQGILSAPENSAEFDYRAYLARQGIHSSMSWPQITVTAEQQGSWLGHRLDGLQTRAADRLRRLLPDPHGALLRGILLGNDDDLSPELSAAFQTTGMTHIIAISGFNIALLAGMMLQLFTPLLGPRPAVLVAALVITLYTLLVGADASVVRAALMGGISLLTSRWLGRTSDGPLVLLLVGGIMTAIRPDWLWDVGFQLSFAATLSLMLYADPLTVWVRQRLERWLPQKLVERLLGWLSEAVLLTLAAQLLTLPLMLLHFGQLSLISLPANALILPAQPAVMSWGGLATLAGLIHPWLGQPFAWVSWLFLEYTITLVELMATVPGAAVAISLPPAGAIALYCLIAFLTWQRRHADSSAWRRALGHLPWRQFVMGGAILGSLLNWAWAASLPDGQLHIYFLDIGQGDATLIRTATGRLLLIDGGQFPARLQEQLSDHLPFWQRSLDMVVATHPDADHVGGLPAVLDRYQISYLLVNGEPPGRAGPYAALLSAAAAQGVEPTLAQAGQIIWLEDGLYLEVLHPGTTRSENRNDNSIVLRLVYGDFSLLLTGDIEAETEKALLEGNALPPTYALKVAHHGSETSTTAAFLRQLGPSVAVISAGVDNQFGHPHELILGRLGSAYIPVLRTDELHTIEFITDGHYLTMLKHP